MAAFPVPREGFPGERAEPPAGDLRRHNKSNQSVLTGIIAGLGRGFPLCPWIATGPLFLPGFCLRSNARALRPTPRAHRAHKPHPPCFHLPGLHQIRAVLHEITATRVESGSQE